MKTQTKRKTLDFSYPRVKIRMGKIITKASDAMRAVIIRKISDETKINL